FSPCFLYDCRVLRALLSSPTRRSSDLILELAREAGLPAVFVDPGPWKNKLDKAAQKEICDRLRAAGIDLVVLAGFMRRLKEPIRSEEHTSELQSRENLVCRLLLEKKKI